MIATTIGSAKWVRFPQRTPSQSGPNTAISSSEAHTCAGLVASRVIIQADRTMAARPIGTKIIQACVKLSAPSGTNATPTSGRLVNPRVQRPVEYNSPGALNTCCPAQ
jgi:hypothetical protein